MLLPSDIIGIDHVQVAAPQGCERKARAFYGKLLGLTELSKPPELRRRGGCWFQCGSAQLHVGVAADFQPAAKAHPALSVSSARALAERLTRKGVRMLEDVHEVDGRVRFFVADPFGNRIEFTEPAAVAAHQAAPQTGEVSESEGYDE